MTNGGQVYIGYYLDIRSVGTSRATISPFSKGQHCGKRKIVCAGGKMGNAVLNVTDPASRVTRFKIGNIGHRCGFITISSIMSNIQNVTAETWDNGRKGYQG